MSERETDECATHGDVLRWSSDSDVERTTDKTDDITIASDTSGCTPDIFKSPEITDKRVPGSIITDGVEGFDIDSRRQAKTKGDAGTIKLKFKGVKFVPETEQQDATSESDDDVPVAMLLKPKKAGSLTLQQIQECKEGPQGDKAVGKTVAKIFDGVKFTGIY